MKNKIVVVDLGGTNLRVALVSDGAIKKIIKRKTPKSNLTNEIIKEISKVITQDVKGIGMGTPGFFKNGKVFNSPNLKINPNLGKEIEKRFRKKVFIENDAKCAAIAELKYGV